MSNAPTFVIEDFQLQEWELLSGEPVFLLPIGLDGKPCPFEVAANIEAYSYNHAAVDPERMFPCLPKEWDGNARCLYQGKLGSAVIALGKTAGVLIMNGVGYFGRNVFDDMHWELQVVATKK